MIIKENFGKEFDMSLYGCTYSEDELIKVDNNEELLFPIVKLIKKNTIWSFVIKFESKIELEKSINNFILYFVSNIESEDYINTIEIDKNINSNNILEKLIEFSL